MMMLCSENECTGCAACLNSCPTTAIDMQEDTEGFLVPVIDERKCNSCGLCSKACPVLANFHPPRSDAPQVYAAWGLDESIRTESSSGGVFSVLADQVLLDSGIIFGAAFDRAFKLSHYEAKNKEELRKLRGSKYLQSSIGETYAKVKAHLRREIRVLFVGTPCQIAGLYGYLQKDYTNLITCDLVCHGVPSQSFFDEYLNYLRFNGYAGFDEIDFRDKRNWGRATILTYYSLPRKEVLLSGQDDYYQEAFIRGLISRRSCDNCQYARIPRIGDFTLGDFWGLGKEIPFNHDQRQGVSLLLVNSSHGQAVLQYCREALFLEERQLSEAKKMNPRLYQPGGCPPERHSFLQDMKTMSIREVHKKYRLQKKVHFKEIARKGVYHVLGPGGIALLKKLRNNQIIR